MDNKSYAKCRLCEYKGSCAFNHNGDQELCELNVTHLDLADHDKQIRDEIVIETLESVIKMIADWGYEDLTSVVLRENLKARIEQLKGEQSESY